MKYNKNWGYLKTILVLLYKQQTNSGYTRHKWVIVIYLPSLYLMEFKFTTTDKYFYHEYEAAGALFTHNWCMIMNI